MKTTMDVIDAAKVEYKFTSQSWLISREAVSFVFALLEMFAEKHHRITEVMN